MPKVGKKEFSYSDKGKAKAEAYAEKTGQEVEYPSYDAGGRVETYREGGKVETKSIKDRSTGLEFIIEEGIRQKLQEKKEKALKIQKERIIYKERLRNEKRRRLLKRKPKK